MVNSPRVGGLVALALVAGMLGGVVGAVTISALDADRERPSVRSALPLTPASDGSAAPGTISQIARAALPSVVLINVGDNEAGEGGLGSGFVVDPAGFIVTNLHVVAGAVDGGEEVTVTFMDGPSLPAEVIGGDPAYDIAVLKIDRTGLPALEFAPASAVQVGMSVLAVGAPLGLENTVTSGIVSAIDRPVVAGELDSASFINAIQTDAAINPGNSGGPLLDLSGRVIGVNSAIAQVPQQRSFGTSGSIGLGFAIPSDQAERTAMSLIDTGTSDHPVIGVLLDLSYAGDGARVLTEVEDGQEAVIPGGPAAEAGVEPGDIIMAIDGESIDDGSHLIVVLRSREIGDQVDVLLRNPDGQERTVSVTLSGASE